MERAVRAYWDFRPFRDHEAWAIFRIAAIGEAIGWTLLIIGVVLERLPVWWNYIPVHIAGELHGTLFITYIAASLVLAPSLGWHPLRALVAGLCSVPPYGSLVYEQISALQRTRGRVRQLHALLSYHLLSHASAPGHGDISATLSPVRR